MALVGNKKDLEHKRIVSFETGKKFSRDNNIDFYETSAKNNSNIGQMFTNVSKKILSNITNTSDTITSSKTNKTIKIVQVKEDPPSPRNKCC